MSLKDYRIYRVFALYLPVCFFVVNRNLLVLGLVIVFLFNIGSLNAQRIDSLRSLLKQGDFDNRATVLMNLFIAYAGKDLDSAMYFAKETDKVAISYGDSLLSVRALNAIGWVNEQKGHAEIAIEFYQNGLQKARNNNLLNWEKRLLNSLGVIHNDYGKYDESLKYHFQSLSLREAEQNQSEIAVSTNNIGLVYYRIRDYLKAIEYFERSVNIKEELGNLRRIESTYVNLGLSYSGLGQHEESLDYFSRVLKICEDGCSDRIKIAAFTGSGVAKFWFQDYEESEDDFNASNALSLETQLDYNEVINFYYLSKIRFEQSRLDEAFSFLNESLNRATEKNLREWIKNGYQLYGEIHSKKNEFEEAYSYQRKSDSLNNVILNEEVIRNLAEIQADYLERENLETIQNQDQEISRRNTLLYLSVVIIILISIILFILYRINQLRRKTNRELAEAKRTIEQQNNVLEEKVRERTKELKEANAALMKSNTDLDNFIYKTSHDIRGPLATLQGMCNVALIDINDQKSRDYFDKIGKTAFRLNEILSKLLIINQINNSLIAQNPIDLKYLSEEIVREQCFLSGHNDIKVENEISKLDNFQSDEVLLRIIIGNLVSNAFKFHNSSNRVSSWVRLEAHRENGHLKLNVIDNGIGVDEKASNKIFEIFSKASEVSDTAGLGLYLVKLAVEKLHGKIDHSKTDEGHTKFTVELPLN